MKSYLLGFFGLLISFILVFWFYKFIDLRKEKSTKRKILFYSVIGLFAVLLYFLITLLFFKPQQDLEKETLINTILFSLFLTPLLEEFLYRRIILQHFLNLRKRGMILKDFFIICWFAFCLIIPTFILNTLGLLGSFSLKGLGITILSLLVPFFVILIYGKNNSKFTRYFVLITLIVFQAFLFTFGHGEYAGYGQLALGIMAVLLYIRSNSIIPPLIIHYAWNLLVLIKSFF